jgi:hypothetical protein
MQRAAIDSYTDSIETLCATIDSYTVSIEIVCATIDSYGIFILLESVQETM